MVVVRAPTMLEAVMPFVAIVAPLLVTDTLPPARSNALMPAPVVPLAVPEFVTDKAPANEFAATLALMPWALPVAVPVLVTDKLPPSFELALMPAPFVPVTVPLLVTDTVPAVSR